MISLSLSLHSINSGRALEELRSSLFSRLRSFGGAKRQQQYLMGPTVALTFNFFVSVGIILMNKLVSLPNYPLLPSNITYRVHSMEKLEND